MRSNTATTRRASASASASATPRPATRARTTKRRAREQAALFVPARRPSRLVHDSSRRRRRRRRRRVRLSVRRRYPMSKGLPSVLILDPDTRAELVQAREHPLLESLFRLSQFPISSNLELSSSVPGTCSALTWMTSTLCAQFFVSIIRRAFNTALVLSPCSSAASWTPRSSSTAVRERAHLPSSCVNSGHWLHRLARGMTS